MILTTTSFNHNKRWKRPLVTGWFDRFHLGSRAAPASSPSTGEPVWRALGVLEVWPLGSLGSFRWGEFLCCKKYLGVKKWAFWTDMTMDVTMDMDGYGGMFTLMKVGESMTHWVEVYPRYHITQGSSRILKDHQGSQKWFLLDPCHSRCISAAGHGFDSHVSSALATSEADILWSLEPTSHDFVTSKYLGNFGKQLKQQLESGYYWQLYINSGL